MKYVILNADDYGYRPDVSKAIIDAHLNGILTSTSVLVNFVTSEDASLTKNAPGLGLGLHLNLTSGKPLTQNWLTKYGEFSRPFRNEPRQFDREIWIPFFAKFETSDVYTEYKAQIEKFKELFGKKPTHLDSHHYTSGFDKIFGAFVQVAKEYNLPVRQQVLFDYATNQHLMGNITHIEDLNNKLEKEGVKTTKYFSLKFLNRYENYLEVIQQELEEIKENESIELAFHPGYEEEWRKRDLAILLDPKAKELFKNEDCELISFSDL
jgi:chitin disaccharide deacetylase